jgi:hypothetical protein
MSDQMWFQRVKGSRDGFDGFWMCPTPNCSGAGFTFDIFPTDPEHPANEGWHSFDDDEGADPAWDEDFDEEAGEGEWDPNEPGYKLMEQMDGDDDDDLEGEEWKYGLAPGEVPETALPPTMGSYDSSEEEARYNAPDERPRELDWTDRKDPPPMNTDDIPF